MEIFTKPIVDVIIPLKVLLVVMTTMRMLHTGC